MNINNNSQNLSFNAKLVTDMPIKNAKRFANIENLFSKRTQHYANDEFVVTKMVDATIDPDPLYYLFEKKSSDRSLIFTPETVGEFLKTATDNEIAQKLVKAFKMLKKEGKHIVKKEELENHLLHLENLKKNNEFQASSLEKQNKPELANMYKAMVGQNDKKIKSLEAEFEKLNSVTENDLNKIVGDDSLLKELVDCIV